MKVNILILSTITFCCFCESMQCQSSDQGTKLIYYNAWVTFLNGSLKVKGYLLEVNDSSIVLAGKKKFDTRIIPIKRIDEIKLRKKGKKGRGVLYGIMATTAISTYIAIKEGPDPMTNHIPLGVGSKAVIGSVLLAPIGALFGNVAASDKITIPIKGSQSFYNEQKENLMQYRANLVPRKTTWF